MRYWFEIFVVFWGVLLFFVTLMVALIFRDLKIPLAIYWGLTMSDLAVVLIDPSNSAISQYEAPPTIPLLLNLILFLLSVFFCYHFLKFLGF